jgi:tagaturonate reductase
MTKILQFGEGNFLRSFVDLYFNTLNAEGGDYTVTVVQPISFGSLDAFARQNNRYHVVLRGMQDGEAIEDVYPVDVLADVFSPFAEPEKFDAIARDPELAIIVSNTTEAGICFNENDRIDAPLADITFPAKLTRFLYTRYQAGLGGLHMLPVELIENNADELYRCVDGYIKLWALPAEFKAWNDTQNFYCNTLVDRIVSGHPRDEMTKQHIMDLIGEQDTLASIAEPFGLWAIERKGRIADLIRDGVHNIEVVLTDDINYYKKRKVRVLNGSHTNLVPAALVLGKKTVYDCMQDTRLYAFLRGALGEIIPFVSDDTAATRRFADDVEARFANPYLNHQLMSIALNSISKWRARNLPSFRDYYAKNGHIPPVMTVGFSYLMYLYQTRHAELQDDASNLAYFAAGKPVRAFMADTAVWGEDLTAYIGFADAVEANIARIARGEVLV